MRWISTAMTAAALAAPAAGQAQRVAQDFCHALDRVVDVARSDGDFAYLERSRAAPPHFDFRYGCRAYAATEGSPSAWSCNQNLAPTHLSESALAERVAECLPDAERSRGRYGDTIFTAPRVRIRIDERGAPRAKVGRIVSFRVEAVGDGAEADPRD